MAKTKNAVVYGTVSGIVRRIIAGADDGTLTAANHCGPGESITLYDKAQGTSLEAASAAVQNVIGFPPPSARCAVINGLLLVDAIIMADAVIDTLPSKTLVNSLDAKVGQLYNTITKVFT